MSGTIEVVLALAKMIIASILFILVFFVFKMITWVIYAIVTKKKRVSKAEREQEDIENPKVKKYRLLGGLVGAVQGLIIGAVLLVPIAGFSGVIADMNKTASASTGNGPSIIQDYVPSEFKSYLNVYEDSNFNKVFGWLNLNKGIFKSITTQKINGVSVSLTTELKNVNTLYQKAQKHELLDLVKDGDSENAIKSLSDDDVKGIIKDITGWINNSSVAKFALVDLSNYFAQSLDVNQELKVKQVKWDTETVTMEGSLVNIILPIKGVAIDVMFEDKSFDLVDLDNVNFAMIGRGINGIRRMQLVGKIFVPACDFAIDKFKINEMADNIGINLETINFATADWEVELKAVGQSLVFLQKLSNASNITELSGEELSDLLSALAESGFIDQFDQIIRDYIEEETGISIDYPILSNEVVLNAFIQSGGELISLEEGENIDEEQATTILSGISSLCDAEEEILDQLADVIIQITGIDTGAAGTTTTGMINAAGVINEFIIALDDDEDLDDKAETMVTMLNNDENLITIYSLRGNKYIISSYKMGVLQGTEHINSKILDMFIVID